MIGARLNRNKKIILAVFATVAVVAGLIAVKDKVWSKKENNVQARVLAAIQSCNAGKNTPNSLNAKCLYDKFEKMVDRNSLNDVMAALENIFSQEKTSLNLGTTSCHNPAHIAGEIAYQKGVSFSELLDICSERCGFGCLHGGFIASFEEKGKDFETDYKDACDGLTSDEDIRSCWHITGHGVGEYYGENVEAASQKCLELPTEKARWHCFSGVRMEYLVGSPDNPPRLKFTTEGLISFCKRFPKNYQSDCFIESSFYALKIAGDEAASLDICNQTPLNAFDRARCAGGAGSEYVLLHKDSAETVFNYCQKFGQASARRCIIGALDVFASEWDFMRNGLTLCGLTDKGFQPDCYSYFGQRLERWYDQAKREEVCGEASAQPKGYCLANLIDTKQFELAPP